MKLEPKLPERVPAGSEKSLLQGFVTGDGNGGGPGVGVFLDVVVDLLLGNPHLQPPRIR